MTQNEKRIAFDNRVKELLDQGHSIKEVEKILHVKAWAVKNARYRLGVDMPSQSVNDRPTVDAYLESKLVVGDTSRHHVGETVKVNGKQYQDVSSFFGI